MTPAIFAVLGLLTYSKSFASGFSVPRLLVFALGLVPFAAYVAAGGAVDLRRSLFKPALPLLAVMLVSLAMSTEPWVGLVGRYNGFALGVLGVAIALAYHVAAASVGEGRGHAETERGLRLIAAAGAFIGVHAFAQWQGFDAELTKNLAGHRGISTIGSPVDLGMLLAMLLPIAVAASPVYGIAVALGLVASGARGAWIGAAAGMVVFVFRGESNGRLRVLGVLALLLAGAGYVYTHNDRPFSQSNQERVEIWKVAAKAISERPIIGHGPDSFETTFRRLKSPGFVAAMLSDRHIQADAHDDILEVLATLGVLGLAAYALLLVAAFRATRDMPAVAGAMAALFVNAKVNPVPLETLIVAGVILGYAGSSSRRRVPAPLRYLAPVAALAAIGFVVRLAVADMAANEGTLAGLERAAELNPFELSYKVKLINLSIAELNKTHDIAARTDIMDTARAQALQGLRLRPGNATSWYAAGVEASVEWELGLRSRPPLPYLTRALALDPYFGPLHEAILTAKAL